MDILQHRLADLARLLMVLFAIIHYLRKSPDVEVNLRYTTKPGTTSSTRYEHRIDRPI